MRQIDVPQTLDDPPIVLIFDAHQLGIVIGGMALGILVEQLIIMTIVGAVVSKIYTKYSDGKPAGFVRHALHFRGVPMLGRRYPHGLDREFRP